MHGTHSIIQVIILITFIVASLDIYMVASSSKSPLNVHAMISSSNFFIYPYTLILTNSMAPTVLTDYTISVQTWELDIGQCSALYIVQ